MHFSKIVSAMELPNLDDNDGTPIPLTLEQIRPLCGTHAYIAPYITRFIEEIEAWGRAHMPKHNVLALVNDFEVQTTIEDLKELRSLAQAITPMRRDRVAPMIDNAASFIEHRPHLHYAFMELLDYSLHSKIRELNLNHEEVFHTWFSLVRETAIVDIRQCHFGEILLPRIRRAPLPQSGMSPKDYQRLMAQYNGHKRQIYLDTISGVVDAELNPLYRTLQSIVNEAKETIIGLLPTWGRYHFVKLYYHPHSQMTTAVNFGDLRCLQFNLRNGVNDAV